MMMLKTCSSCKQKLDTKFFSRCAANKDKLQNYCKICFKFKDAQRYKKDKAKILAQHKYWVVHNVVRLQKYKSNWNMINKDNNKKVIQNWRKRNPDKVREFYAVRFVNKKAKLLNIAGKLYTKQWRELKAMYNMCCVCCGRKELSIKLTIDHVVPFAKGGLNIINNIQPLCIECNLSKGVGTIDYRRKA